jgi:thiol-disulfide isomerase/thioredoxin
VAFIGRTTNGAVFNSKTYLGKVAVVNFWYAGCAPCRAEAPTLNAVASEMPDERFVGINVADDAATTTSFEQSHGNIYPSARNKAAQLNSRSHPAGALKPCPSTLVLDRQGRVTARVVGLANKSVLRILVKAAINRAPS